MHRQRNKAIFFTKEELTDFNKKHSLNLEEGLLKSGIIVRHLCLPGTTKDSKAVIKYLYETYKDDIFISIMNQYTPLAQVSDHPKLHRKLSKREYNSVLDYAIDLGLVNGFSQDGSVASESFIPEFDYRGIL